MKYFTTQSVVLFLVIQLAACGGGGDDSGSNSSPPPVVVDPVPDGSTGILLDSPIEGIKYESSTHSGITNLSGEFTFNPSENVSFYIGDVLIAEISPENIVTPLLLMSDSDPKSEVVLNFIRLIQTLDDDNNPDNGIKITSDIAQKVTTSVGSGTLNFQVTNDEFENSTIVQNILTSTENSVLVSKESAYAHLIQSLNAESSISTVYAFNSGFSFNNEYAQSVIFHQVRDDGIIFETKNIYTNTFLAGWPAYSSLKIENPAPALPLTYDIINESSLNTYEAKIDKSWLVLEGVSAQDPTMTFIMQFDDQDPCADLFCKEDGYFSIGVQFEFNNTVYEVEARITDVFVTLSKNNEDIYGEIINAHSFYDNTLKISLPISTFDLTKEDLFDVNNKVNMKLFYRNIDTGLRVWESSVLTRLFFEPPTYYSPSAVKVNIKATENFSVEIGETTFELCTGQIIEHDGMREYTYIFYEEYMFDTYTVYNLGVSYNQSDIDEASFYDTGSCRLMTSESGEPVFNLNTFLKVSGSELKLTSHDIIRLFSPVILYGSAFKPNDISYWESLDYGPGFYLDEHPLINTENNYVEEKLDRDELIAIGGDKLTCPKRVNLNDSCLGDQTKQWEGAITLVGQIPVSSNEFNDSNLATCVTDTASSNNWIYLSDITTLACNGMEILDLHGLEKLTSLSNLNLNNNNISDISSLTDLTSLTYLELGGNSLSDISALSRLTSLNTLYLGFNFNISDLSALSGMTSLKTLDLYFNNISDLSPISGLTSLTNLYLFNNNISNISVLSELTLLEVLDLSKNLFSDLNPLIGLSFLSELNLKENSNISCVDIDALKITLSSTDILSDSNCSS